MPVPVRMPDQWINVAKEKLLQHALTPFSACNMGVGDTSGDGKEVEGLGGLAQRKGAKAVVASLWSVADASRSLLMQEFYRTRESSATTKAEAVRQAQLALLLGAGKTRESDGESCFNARAGGK